MLTLTPRQQDCFRAIQEYYDKHGIMPSISDLMGVMGITSKFQIHNLLIALEERGAIRRLPRRARAIEFVAQKRLAQRYLYSAWPAPGKPTWMPLCDVTVEMWR